jgi:co-chaperonin GroES (HSP10)
MSTIKPTTNHIAVGEKKAGSTTAGGIYIEGGAGDTKLGYVLATGPDVTLVKVGDTVLPRWTDGVKLAMEGKVCVLLKETDITAVIEV